MSKGQINYRVPSTSDPKIFFTIPGFWGRSRICRFTRIKNNRFYGEPERYGSPEDYLCVCIKQVLEDFGFFEAFDNRDDDFRLNIFIREYKKTPYYLLLPLSRDNHDEVYERIIEKIKEIIRRNIEQ